MKIIKSLYYIGTALSMFIGLWHFTVPYMFWWHSYISSEYDSLIVGIDWINFFFSLSLSGLSLLLIVFGRKVWSGNKDVFAFYGFLVFIWLCRVAITFVRPWPTEPAAWAAYGQQIAAFLVFAFLLIPFAYLIHTKKRSSR